MSSPQVQLLYSVPSLGIDESQGPPTLVFVSHQLPLDRFPFSFPSDRGFVISNGWLGQPGVYAQRIELFNPKGGIIVDSGARSFELTGASIPYLAVTFMLGLTFEEPGQHTVVVSLNGRAMLSYPLHVRKVPPLGRET